ncbi:MAG: right-handed parallel beta-helix repeat-containing protein, partial [Candidatus Thorarchaeota archaeon]
KVAVDLMGRNTAIATLLTFLVVSVAFAVMALPPSGPAQISDRVGSIPGHRARIMAYTDHAPIKIGSNADFAALGFPGNGTEANPYVIENLRIVEFTYAIRISNTSVHFVIRNCSLVCEMGTSIQLEDVSNARITNNDIARGTTGVSMENSSAVIANNTIRDTGNGVSALSSDGTIANNTFENNLVAMSIYASPGMTVVGNAMTNCGMFVASTARETPGLELCANNTVNGRMLGYFWNLTDATIDASLCGQIILLACENVTVRNAMIANSSIGMEIFNSSHCTVADSVFTNQIYGVGVFSSPNCTVRNVTAWSQSAVFGAAAWTIYASGVLVGPGSNDTTLESCELWHLAQGAELAAKTRVTGSTFYDNQVGISLGLGSNKSVIVDNEIHSNTEAGIGLFLTFEVEIIANEIYDNGMAGISLTGTHWARICNNHIHGNSLRGVSIEYSRYNMLAGNVFEHDGIGLYAVFSDEAEQDIANNNTVNGKPVGYYWNASDTVIDASGLGQVILANCTNVTVTGGMFYKTFAGVTMATCTNCTVIDTTTEECLNGVFIESSANSTLLDNAFYRNYAGTDVFRSMNTTIINNTYHDDFYGLLLDTSRNGILRENAFFGDGIYIQGGSLAYWHHSVDTSNVANGLPIGYFLSDSGNVIDGEVFGQLILANCSDSQIRNMAFNNVTAGIQVVLSENITLYNITLAHCFIGGVFFESDRNTFSNCSVFENRMTGLLVSYSHMNMIANSTIRTNGFFENRFNMPVAVTDQSGLCLSGDANIVANNTIYGNMGYGIYIAYGTHNLVYNNMIGANAAGNAMDNGRYSYWNFTDIGNAWSDCEDTGAYSIPGYANSKDYYPRRWSTIDSTPPTISTPDDIEYVIGTTGHNITWNASEEHPFLYKIYRNGTLVESGQWDGGNVTICVDGLELGAYEYTLVLYDEYGNGASDTVIVSVVEPQPTTTTATTTTSTTTGQTSPTTGSTTTAGGFPLPSDPLVLVLGGLFVVIVIVVIARRRQ